MNIGKFEYFERSNGGLMPRQDNEDKTHFDSMTFGLIKPDAFERKLIGEVIYQVEQHLAIRVMRMSLPGADFWHKFYQEHQGRAYYDTLVQFMSSGPIIAMVLTINTPNAEWQAGEPSPAVRVWRGLMGASSPRKRLAGTIRHRLALDQPEHRNLVHGSDSDTAVEREVILAERYGIL